MSGTNNALNITGAGAVIYDGAGTWTASTYSQYAILIGGSSNAITGTSLTNGQLLIGSTGATPSAATLTAGTGVSIANASGSITINAIGAGLSWTVVTASTQAGAVNNGYISNYAGQLLMTLPATSAVGSVIAITGINSGNGWKVAQNAGNQIFFGTQATTAGTGGFLASTNTYDSIYMLCVTTNADWVVLNSVGNITWN